MSHCFLVIESFVLERFLSEISMQVTSQKVDKSFAITLPTSPEPSTVTLFFIWQLFLLCEDEDHNLLE